MRKLTILLGLCLWAHLLYGQGLPDIRMAFTSIILIIYWDRKRVKFKKF